MTETRKQIIELIEPYMDKSLRNGVWFKKDLYWISTHYFQAISNLTITEPTNRDLDYLLYLIWVIDKAYIKDIEILWHYDITAVLDYINSFTNEKWVWLLYFDNILWQKDFWTFQKTDYSWYVKIPKKPLHLYTEQEETSLLELLLKLKN